MAGTRHTHGFRELSVSMATDCTSQVKGECKNGTHKHLWTQRKYQLVPATPANTLELANESPSHIIQTLSNCCLCTGSQDECVCA